LSLTFSLSAPKIQSADVFELSSAPMVTGVVALVPGSEKLAGAPMPLSLNVALFRLMSVSAASITSGRADHQGPWS